MKTIRLHKGREESILRRHPWIFSRAIGQHSDALSDGDIVLVQDSKGNVLGTGHFQNSSLAVRLFAFEEVHPDENFWKTRLENAYQYRADLGIPKTGYTNAFRLVHGEGDQLPGLIVDIYDSVAVLQAHSIGMHRALPDIAKALLSIQDLGIRFAFDKSKDALPAQFGQTIEDTWLTNQGPNECEVLEQGFRFAVDIITGQKTGFFLDQRDNRAWVGQQSDQAEVLNCFSYSGGFSLYALCGGARQVTSIDSSAQALTMLEKNLALNEYAGNHKSIKENVLTYLTSDQNLYDIVIVDPPAFAKSMAKRHNAVQAYKRLNILAMRRVRPGGLLFTFSCSQVVDKPLFHNTLVAASIESGRQVRIARDLSQGPDHPVSIFHPEGAYLKGLMLYVE